MGTWVETRGQKLDVFKTITLWQHIQPPDFCNAPSFQTWFWGYLVLILSLLSDRGGVFSHFQDDEMFDGLQLGCAWATQGYSSSCPLNPAQAPAEFVGCSGLSGVLLRTDWCLTSLLLQRPSGQWVVPGRRNLLMNSFPGLLPPSLLHGDGQ